MKTKLQYSFIPLVLLTFSTLNSQVSTARAQGGLTPPPGVPGPTMKTLTQIEPRTAIASAPFTISVPGSYYLTTNITVTNGTAIIISANNVTLDLNGFTISSTQNPATTGAGIILNSTMNTTIVNGFISSGVTNNGAGVFSGSGFGHGIYYAGTFPFNAYVARVTVSGCLLNGIYLAPNNSAAQACTVYSVGGVGVYADVISDSSALVCGSYGVYGATAHNCYGYGVGGGSAGVYVNTANNCYGYNSGAGTGLHASTATGCYGYSNGGGKGLEASVAHNCYGYSNSNIGLDATCAENCSGTSGGTSDGLDAEVAQNCYGSSNGDGLYARRTASGCFGSSISGYGLVAPIVNSCAGTSFLVTHNLNSY